jgi:hypothetical protein
MPEDFTGPALPGEESARGRLELYRAARFMAYLADGVAAGFMSAIVFTRATKTSTPSGGGGCIDKNNVFVYPI